MVEPIRVNAYRCPICNEQMFDYTLKKARQHVKVPVDRTRLQVGLFFGYRMKKDDPLYAEIIDNSGRLQSDHSYEHTIETFYLNWHGVLTSSNTYEKSFGDILRRFKENLSRFLSQGEFDKLFSNTRNRKMVDIEPLRTCAELEGLLI
jgi:hypothetical protein